MKTKTKWYTDETFFWIPFAVVGGAAAVLMFLFAGGMTFWPWVLISLAAGGVGGFIGRRLTKNG